MVDKKVIEAEETIKKNGGSIEGKVIHIENPNDWAQEAIQYLISEHNYILNL